MVVSATLLSNFKDANNKTLRSICLDISLRLAAVSLNFKTEISSDYFQNEFRINVKQELSLSYGHTSANPNWLPRNVQSNGH
jgi:hypothetical protein